MPSPERRLLLVGAGWMAREYLKVLSVRGWEVDVIGRSTQRSARLAAELGVRARGGGIQALDDVSEYAGVIVATGISELAAATTAAVERGAQAVLAEKPGGLYRHELESLVDRRGETPVWIAYNRRFFASVDATRQVIADDGGLISMHFDFTELSGRVLPVMGARTDGPQLLARLGIANSLHVIDLFLHLAGLPAEWSQVRGGDLDWHPAGAVFCGAGRTDADVYFSYLATWNGAGRWGLELATPLHKLVLRPLEELYMQARDSFSLDRVDLPEEPEDLKPGLPGLVDAFLASLDGHDDPRLASIDEALAHFLVAETIFGYDEGASSQGR